MNEHSVGTRASVRPSVGNSGTPEARAAEYIIEASNGELGSGDDPVGFLIASHRALRAERDDAVKRMEAGWLRVADSGIRYFQDQTKAVIDYIDGFYVSGNSVPIDRPWINAASWEIAKELLALGLPLEHTLIEQECVYRRKLAAYGDETRAKSPLQERLLAARTDSTRSGDQIKPDGVAAPDQGSVRNATDELDAKRYRWMRQNWAYADGTIFFDGFNLGPMASLDEAIDAIRALPDQKD